MSPEGQIHSSLVTYRPMYYELLLLASRVEVHSFLKLIRRTKHNCAPPGCDHRLIDHPHAAWSRGNCSSGELKENPPCRGFEFDVELDAPATCQRTTSFLALRLPYRQICRQPSHTYEGLYRSVQRSRAAVKPPLRYSVKHLSGSMHLSDFFLCKINRTCSIMTC